MMTAEATSHLSTRYTYALPSPHENQLLFRTSNIAGSLRSAGPQLYIITPAPAHPPSGKCKKTQKLGRISQFRSNVVASSQSPAAGLPAKVVVFVRLRSA